VVMGKQGFSMGLADFERTLLSASPTRRSPHSQEHAQDYAISISHAVRT
jgi:hypothetical protein